MENFLLRSKVLNNIPIIKKQDKLDSLKNLDLKVKNLKTLAINRYAESNIPIEYWDLKMEKDFSGNPILLKTYTEYLIDLKKSYTEGKSYCFAGNLGVGKTFTTCSIVKKAVEKNYTGLYTTLSDVVAALTQAPNDEKFIARKELCLVDFLILDEVDPRFIGSDSASDLFARTLESVFRTRSHNKLPTFMCTNSPNVLETFSGTLKQSLGSLMKGYLKVIPVLGEDFRKKEKCI